MPRRDLLRAWSMGGAAAAALAVAACATAEPFPKLTYAERSCYRTLGVVDCHPTPLAGEEGRRVGFYDAPIAIEQEEAWPQRLF